MEVKIGSFTFFSNFDSGNLARVERVKRDSNGEATVQPVHISSFSLQEQGNVLSAASLNSPISDFEFNLWTSPDCAGSPYENLNRTWFYFGVKGGQAGKVVKFNLMNLNKQGKLYNQGMTPLVKVLPCRNKWERIRERPFCEVVDGQFQLSFVYCFPHQRNVTCYFAFCYPYSYEETQTYLRELDYKFQLSESPCVSNPHAIYYHRELLCKSIDGLRVDLLTVTSFKGILQDRELRLEGLFPDVETLRANQFQRKKIFVLTSRVHPGETPASYVFKGFLDFITRPNDPRASMLRDRYVFKLIPLLNPDGVKRGHYRTDERGVNLNRVYLEPSPELHPSIYATKAIVAYHYDGTLTLRHNGSDEDNSARDKISTAEDAIVFGVGHDCSGHRQETLPDAVLRVEETGSSFLCSVGQEQLDKRGQEGHDIGEDAQRSLVPKGMQCENMCKSEAKTRENCESCALSEQRLTSVGRKDSGSEKVTNGEEWKGKGLESSDGSDSACDVARNSREFATDGESPDAGDHGSEQSTVPGSFTCISEKNGPPTEPLLRNTKASDVVCEMAHQTEVNENKVTLPALVQKDQVSITKSIEVSDRSDTISLNKLEGVISRVDENADVTVTSTQPSANENPTDETQQGESTDGNSGTQWDSGGGLAFYVDLHGHASKRGCFMYGNYIEDEDKYVQCLLFPKLVSVNSAHFDFTACNFTEKNMYSRDKRDGMSKEGSGRVAMYKMTGLPHCYTLECNYNCGRSSNAVPPATCDDGRATPPPPPGFPPRYTPEIYEEVGRAVAVSALDMVNANPWSRLPTSEHGCLEGVRNWVYRYVKSNKNSPAIQKKTQKVTTRTSSFVAQTGSITHRPIHKVSSTNNDLIPHGANDIPESVRSLDRIAKQRSSLHNMTENKKNQSSIYGIGRNQVSSRTKDQGRKRLDVAKTTPLLMLPNGDTNAAQLRLERNDIKHFSDKHVPLMRLERQKSSVIKKLRDNLATMRMEAKLENADVNSNISERERKNTKLRYTMTVKQLDCANSAGVTDVKSENFNSTSKPKEEISSKEPSKISKRPLISRRRKSRRAIRQESAASKLACEVVDVKSLQGHEISRKNSSQVSL